MQLKFLLQFSYRFLIGTLKKKGEYKISFAILVWWKIAWCVKYVCEFSLSYLGPHTQPLVVLLPFSFSLKKYFNTWHFCCLAAETVVTFELFDMLDGGNSLNFSSLQVISSLLSVHLRKILGLSYSRAQEKQGSESLHTGLEAYRCLLIGLNPIFTLVLIQPHFHNVPFTHAFSRGIFWIWIFTCVWSLQ